MSISWDDQKELRIVKGSLGQRYELIEHLGRGAYGMVYKIKDRILERECALKILNMEKFDTHDDKEDAKKRFIKEARTYAKCENFSIVPIYDVGGEITIPYLIMKYIKGKSLKKILKERTKLGLNEIIKIAGHILPALEYIHSMGLVHRDLKPANIMIEEETERSILIDFGIVKDLETLGGTKSGIIIGTPYYMAPEQFSGLYKVGPKSDIYSFGVALYEMLTGEVPFKGEKAAIIMYEHLSEPVPDVRKKNPDLPMGIENIIFKAMAKKPNDRFKSARNFLNDLSQIEETRKMIIKGDEKEKEIEKIQGIKPDDEKKEKIPGKIELRQKDKEEIEKIKKKKDVELKVSKEDEREKIKEEEKKEVEKVLIKPERKSKRKAIKDFKIYVLGIIVITVITAFFVFDPLGIMQGKDKVKINYTENI
jgi:serine/threonine protein kinase